MAETNRKVLIFSGLVIFQNQQKWEGAGKLFLSHLVCLTREWGLNYHEVSNLASIYELLCEKI